MNTVLRKRNPHLISFYSGNTKTQTDFVLVRDRDRNLVTDAKIVPYETVALQHRPLICTLKVAPPRVQQGERCGAARIKWWRMREKEKAVTTVDNGYGIHRCEDGSHASHGGRRKNDRGSPGAGCNSHELSAPVDEQTATGSPRADGHDKRSRLGISHAADSATYCVAKNGINGFRSNCCSCRRHVLPVRRNLPYFQSEQSASVSRMLQESPCRSPSRRCQGGDLNNLEYGRDSSISAPFAAMALPDVGIYEDAHGKGFESFLKSFLIKYKELNLPDDVLIYLLCSKLKGYPFTVMQTLPVEIRECSFSEFTAALSVKFKQNDAAKGMEAHVKLKNLKCTESIADYCVELEKLSRTAYPELTEGELSTIRTGELITQLMEWPEYVQMFAIVEQTPSEETYERLKTLAHRVERSSDVAKTLKHETVGSPIRSEPHWRKVVAQGEMHLKMHEENIERSINKKHNRAAFLQKDVRLKRANLFATTVGNQVISEGIAKKLAKVSILPLKLLQKAAKAGFDLDEDVEEIRDAGAVRLTIEIEGLPSMRAAFYVIRGGDGMIGVVAGEGTNASVVTRVYIKPGDTKTVELTARKVGAANVLWSTDELIADAILTTTSEIIRRTGPPKRGYTEVEIGLPQDDPLHLYYPCTCGIFNERAHVGFPGLRCNLACSKKVKNLFELANVASIALEPAWGEHGKEAELVKKNSTHLTVVGLSCAISAHRHFCHDFATAIAEKEGVHLSHPTIFSHYPGYDTSAYYAQAIARKDQISEFYRSDDMPLNSIIVALPKSFARATTDLDPEPTV
ncbi:unnamed protein product [Heligmosomoides polygyrus]|uniref:Retrotrans_gag domain-containing protein n=1 Tax=Heligmosomoides polygyrus TaxID=6339 RepID=A0A183FWK6_HELPZ|nr:unnamed protein product [Heligmosomoides polygyrus]